MDCVYWDPFHGGRIVQYDQNRRAYVTALEGRHVAWNLVVVVNDDGDPNDVFVRSASRRHASVAVRAHLQGRANDSYLYVQDDPEVAAEWATRIEEAGVQSREPSPESPPAVARSAFDHILHPEV
jgi:hypothetical protein